MSRTFAPDGPIVVTGGAGFIGSNLAHRLASDGHRVRVFDNLSRRGVEQNAGWLRETHGERIELIEADVRDAADVQACVRGAAAVFHLAAQVAVTSSLVDPLLDFEINARGTLNVLEAARMQTRPPAVVLTSTNKVYGGLEDLELSLRDGRYLPTDDAVREHGIGESRRLDFHSPYGCSKGAADQYAVDWARSFGVPTAVFRMSCIYGPRQFGTEDQGWVAHFLLQALRNEPITIFGDGCQVRDILYVDDLIDALQAVMARASELSGSAFNIGGGPNNVISLNDLLARIERLDGRRAQTQYGAWRIGDQRYYVSDTRAFELAAGWHARVGAADGIARLYEWLKGRQQRRPMPTAHAAEAQQQQSAGSVDEVAAGPSR